ncbi:hypothetical protein ACH34I_15100 [Elizabethkingia anophelis]
MNTQRIENILDNKKIPITSMRMLVLDAFLEAPQALSLSDLEEKLAQSDRSTLYRTLKTFEKKVLFMVSKSIIRHSISYVMITVMRKSIMTITCIFIAPNASKQLVWKK